MFPNKSIVFEIIGTVSDLADLVLMAADPVLLLLKLVYCHLSSAVGQLFCLPAVASLPSSMVEQRFCKPSIAVRFCGKAHQSTTLASLEQFIYSTIMFDFVKNEGGES